MIRMMMMTLMMTIDDYGDADDATMDHDDD